MMFEAGLAGWAVTLAAIGGLITFDLWYSHRHPRAIGIPEAPPARSSTSWC